MVCKQPIDWYLVFFLQYIHDKQYSLAVFIKDNEIIPPHLSERIKISRNADGLGHKKISPQREDFRLPDSDSL